MRMIERSTIFKRDYKREMKGRYRLQLNEDLKTVLGKMMDDLPLPPRYHDHNLSGDWIGYRECHIKPDLLLIYRKTADGILRLARLGSHGLLL